ncbi:TPA: hypothetical protein MI617_27785 [Klebsiella pneumoniae]|uniref:type II secretion system protein GspD n=1 Tax=Klebsiella pneumoniae TaxID=573 RepID=UPI002010AC4A|nr:hypothetical protein [Klebsiella pneumoniae]MCL0227816.1 hypothetical protein [Klebsiella pneumoniae]MCL1456575.1 hypothetical protein [Klebsiella pneumoniae]HBV6324282.1 hypothetical protein [Klebsiella pneumoniae]HBY7341178.1 hypothetical protein [Klebsiella pneumoniae]HBY7346849.1 hypothetical protein [Klebsiella pneumoniae]
MKKTLISFALLASSFYCNATNIDLSITDSPLNDVITLVYSDILKKPFMLDPAIVEKSQKVTFYFTKNQDFEKTFNSYLTNLGYEIKTKSGVDYIRVAPERKVSPPKSYVYVYHPFHRTVSYLSDIISSSFQSNFSTVTSIGDGSLTPGSVTPNSAGQMLSRTGDRLVFNGTRDRIEELKKLLLEIDVPSESVEITGYLYEVATNKKNGSGMQLAAKLLSSKFKVGMGTTRGYSNFISISSGSVDALYELFSTDSRFTVVSAPRLTVDSGEKASFAVGDDVPVLNTTTITDGTVQQGVTYQSAGVLFNVSPEVISSKIRLNFTQELSSFVETTTGVNDSPTKTKRTIQSVVTVDNGAIIVVGGLASRKKSDNKTGLSFLPDLFAQSSDSDEHTDLIAVIQVRKLG